MDKKKISLILIGVAVFSSIFLYGCKVETIQFNRESQAQNLLNKFSNTPQAKVNKSSGMIILKDESKDNFNIRFGPSDLNFDLPAKY